MKEAVKVKDAIYRAYWWSRAALTKVDEGRGLEEINSTVTLAEIRLIEAKKMLGSVALISSRATEVNVRGQIQFDIDLCLQWMLALRDSLRRGEAGRSEARRRAKDLVDQLETLHEALWEVDEHRLPPLSDRAMNVISGGRT